MQSTLRIVNLNSGGLSKLLVGLTENDQLAWTLVVNKPNPQGGTTEAQIKLTEHQADLVLKVAAQR